MPFNAAAEDSRVPHLSPSVDDQHNDDRSLKPEPSTVSDETLAGETQAGSLESFEQLVHRYEHRIFAFISQFCSNSADATELTQDTFVKAFQKIGQFDASRTFAPWLFTIARRNCIDRHRHAPPLANVPLPDIVDDTTPSDLMAQREEGENLWQLARERLGKTQFQALWLHYAEEMDVAQIAQVLGKTRVHVKVLLFRARQILAREMRLKRTDGTYESFRRAVMAPHITTIVSSSKFL